ncbi:MAG: UbiH/UbiF/VisC/COQ6 family ubiquinone biosynthesis hydroxylase [Alphaproteobacteria bacterium]|nr:UbiH/UbiF/VisC/COQ6 family ubiquinone biosynthesis hydroxylase [Alphaproteobacteria bacterium]
MTADGQITADVAIAGGGLVGLSLGVALARAGLDTVVMDGEDPARSLSAEFDGRVCSIAYASKRVLDGIGVWHGMAGEAEAILEIRVSDGDAPLFLHYDHREVGDDPLGWIVENRVTRTALLEAAAGCARLRHLAPVSVTEFTPSTERITATLADGRHISARLAVAADGRHSRLRRAAGIGTMDWSYEQTGIVCTVRHARPHRGIAHERFLPGGPFAILPMTDGRASIVWSEKSDLAPHLLALDGSDFHAELAARFGDFLGELEITGQRWSYPIALTHANRYGAERLALAGDAAHAIHPLAGQGFNLGVRDVAVLAELIVDRHRLGLDIGAADLLARYQQWRRLDSLTLIAVTDGLNRLFSNDIAALRLARDLGLAAVNRTPRLKRLFMRHAMGLVGELPRLARGEPL